MAQAARARVLGRPVSPALMRKCAWVHAFAMDQIYSMQAEVLKTLASPRRLEILHRLAESPCEVGKLADELGMSQPNVSQHLAVLRSAGLVEAEREGREVHYRLVDADVMVACSVMRGVLQRRIARLASLSADAQGETPHPASTR
jgi:DNA-binding transcriptional ArsR family regulator